MMKRYVKEFANEFLKNPLMKECYKESIRRILWHCENGRITNQEAVSLMLKSFEEWRDEE